MNRDFAVVRDALQQLGQFVDVNGHHAPDSAEERKELLEVRASALEALTRLATPASPVVHDKQPPKPCEIFWDGNGHYYRLLSDNERVGPFDTMQLAWEDATANGCEVVRVSMTRGSVPART